MTHVSHNYKLKTPVRYLAEILRENFQSSTKITTKESPDDTISTNIAKGELLVLFEYYVRECLSFIMEEVSHLVKFYLWYRDCVFYLDSQKENMNWKSFEDYEDFI